MNPPVSLDVQGYGGRRVENRFWRNTQPVGWLAVLLPGMGYHSDKPLLYYTRMTLLHRGLDVLDLMPGTSSEEFQQAAVETRLAWLDSDMKAGIESGLAQGSYQGILLAGKSIGTIGVALGLPFAASRLATAAVWLTPLLREPVLVEAAMRCESRQLFVCSWADQTFRQDRLEQILETCPLAVSWVAPQGNHSLEIEGDERASLHLLSQVVETTAKFIDGLLLDE